MTFKSFSLGLFKNRATFVAAFFLTLFNTFIADGRIFSHSTSLRNIYSGNSADSTISTLNFTVANIHISCDVEMIFWVEIQSLVVIYEIISNAHTLAVAKCSLKLELHKHMHGVSRSVSQLRWNLTRIEPNRYISTEMGSLNSRTHCS